MDAGFVAGALASGGAELTVMGSGFASGESVTISVDGNNMGSLTADGKGVIAGAMTVNLSGGTYGVIAQGGAAMATAPLLVK